MKKNSRHFNGLPIYFDQNIKKQSSFPWFSLMVGIIFIFSLDGFIYDSNQQMWLHFEQLLACFDSCITFNIKIYNWGLFNLTMISDLELLNNTHQIIEIAMLKNIIIMSDVMYILNNSHLSILDHSLLSNFYEDISVQNCAFNNLISDLEAQTSYLSQ